MVADQGAPLQTPQAAPIAAYSFDEGEGETAEDLSGNGHEGSIEGAAWTYKGRYGPALDFDGEEDCVSTPNTPALQLTEEFTLEAWVRPELHISGDPVIVKETEEGDSFALGLGFQEDGTPEAFVGEGEEQTDVASSEEVPQFVWTHLAATFDGAKLRLFVNGDLVATEEIEDPPVAGTGPLRVGCSDQDGEFAGRIDEVRIYNRALDGGEVVADQGAPLQTPQAAPIAAYSFDEGEGEVASDLTGNHNGSLDGAEWVKGKYGSALYLDGSEDFVEIPDSPELQLTEEFTLEAWVRPSVSQKWAPVISKETSSFYSYRLLAGSREVAGVPEGLLSDEPFSWEDVEGEEALPVNAWSHLALTYDEAKLRLYVNGSLVDEASGPHGQASEGPLLIGATDGEDFFKGRIDEVRIYNRALDGGEVVADQGAETTPPTIELSGPLAEGMLEEAATYPLEITAKDGLPGKPGTGVQKLTIFLDGEQVYRATQVCELSNCTMTRTWTYAPAEYYGDTHEFLVTAEDQAGNVGSTAFGITAPDGDVTNCDSNGDATSGPSKTVSLGSGGSLRVFEGKDFTYEQPIPPPAFDPLLATDEELDEYGFPARPEDGDSLSEWQNTMAQYEETVSSDLCVAPAGTSAPAELTGGDTFANWSGYRTIDPKGENAWAGITGNFVQPFYHPTKCKHTSSSHWIGLGTYRLIQGGTVIDSDHEIWPFVNFIQPEYSHPDIRVPKLKIRAKDRVRLTLFYEVANERLQISFFNNTTGGSTRYYVKGLPHQFYDGSAGEFIDERRSNALSGNYLALPNYDVNEWHGTKVFTRSGAWQKLSKANPRRILMKAGGKILSAPGYIRADGKSFNNNFFHCSPLVTSASKNRLSVRWQLLALALATTLVLSGCGVDESEKSSVSSEAVAMVDMTPCPEGASTGRGVRSDERTTLQRHPESAVICRYSLLESPEDGQLVSEKALGAGRADRVVVRLNHESESPGNGCCRVVPQTRGRDSSCGCGMPVVHQVWFKSYWAAVKKSGKSGPRGRLWC